MRKFDIQFFERENAIRQAYIDGQTKILRDIYQIAKAAEYPEYLECDLWCYLKEWGFNDDVH